ncbi:MAG: hypothetical protein HQL63_10895 [Magnetococcales bacterium]|nr:hypothetical protein [Magnetococcales bacterium]MBF0321605.1 hypothetical protein [Magnetococcales bacterium]
MPQTLTIDDIWKLFQETNRLMQEADARWDARWDAHMASNLRDLQETMRIIRENSAETERMFRETERQSQETERMFRETERQSQETDRKFQETDRKFQETDRKFQETDRQSQETDRKIKEVSKQIGRLGGRWGEFVEGLVAPACETLFAERGIPIHKVSPRIKAKLPGNRHMEIDLLVVNSDSVALVEVKSRLTHEDVQEHLQRLAEFKDFFPEYADRRVMGAVAGIVMDENVNRHAMNEGLFVIVQSGESVQMANDAAFKPRVW